MRKGSLQLSINAIVILIMAIAMLGVGIFFINTVLKGNITDVTTLSDDVKQQIKQTLRETDEKVFISGAPDNNVDISQNKEAGIFIVVNNKLASSAEFNVTITRDTNSSGHSCGISDCDTNFLGLSEFYSKGNRVIAVGEVEDFKVDFSASSKRGTVIYMVKVFVDDGGTVPYATKELHVTVN